MWVSLVTAVLEVANPSSGSLPWRGISRKVHSCCPGAVSWSEPSRELVPWGAGGVCAGMCSVVRSGDLWQRSWAESSGTWPAELLLQDLPVVSNQSWARKCEQAYQKYLCDLGVCFSMKPTAQARKGMLICLCWQTLLHLLHTSSVWGRGCTVAVVAGAESRPLYLVSQRGSLAWAQRFQPQMHSFLLWSWFTSSELKIRVEWTYACRQNNK